MVVSIVRAREDELLYDCLTLATYLTEDDAHRKRFLSTGILHVLTDILLVEYNTPHHQTYKLLELMAALLSHLAVDDREKELLCVKYPAVDCLLHIFHNAITETQYKAQVIRCLTVLCKLNWQIRQRAGKHCITTVIKEMRLSTSAEYVTIILEFLKVLALFKPNCVDMEACEVHERLAEACAKLTLLSESTKDLGRSIQHAVRTLNIQQATQE